MDGLKRVLANNGFTVSDKVQAEMEAYNEQNNPVIGFLKDLSIADDVVNKTTSEVYLRYKLYCSEYGFTAMSAGEFSKFIKKEYGLDIKIKKVNGKTVRLFEEV